MCSYRVDVRLDECQNKFKEKFGVEASGLDVANVPDDVLLAQPISTDPKKGLQIV